MARMSLAHSFLSGASLWVDDSRPVASCANDRVGVGKISAACQKFLDANERAQTQWTLEEQFAGFEKKF
jgi:adenosine deaminase